MIKLAAAAILSVSSCQPAMAESICGTSIEVWEGLRSYGEERYSVGLTDDGSALAESWGNEITGTWTFLMTSPQGMSCIVAHGSGFAAQHVVNGDPA